MCAIIINIVLYTHVATVVQRLIGTTSRRDPAISETFSCFVKRFFIYLSSRLPQNGVLIVTYNVINGNVSFHKTATNDVQNGKMRIRKTTNAGNERFLFDFHGQTGITEYGVRLHHRMITFTNRAHPTNITAIALTLSRLLLTFTPHT